jgi:hypothetical protein
LGRLNEAALLVRERSPKPSASIAMSIPWFSALLLGYLVRQKLQRDEAVQPYILGLVDHTHPAATKLGPNHFLHSDALGEASQSNLINQVLDA